MVNPGTRMNILKVKTLALRFGRGAAVLPPEITRIHLDFAQRWNDGHMGPRKFWKECMPRLKFWNPAIPMIVNRSKSTEGPAIMSIYFRKPGVEPIKNTIPLAAQPHSSTENETPAWPPNDDERVETIEMKNVHSDNILEQFLAKTQATLVQPTPDEQVEIRQVKDLKERGEVDRAIRKAYVDNKRRQERLILEAKKEAEAIKLANQ